MNDPAQAPSRPSPRSNTRVDSANFALAVAALVLGLVIGGGIMAIVNRGSDDKGTSLAKTITTTGYQAVILSNDKVYFGQLRVEDATFFRLDHAYFLREAQATGETQPVRSLVPVNREIHAPENRMLIRRDAVVLVENLASDSAVLKEIRRQEGGGSTTSTPENGASTTAGNGTTSTTKK